MMARQIISPSAGLFNQADVKSGRETDALFGETVDVLSESKGWAEVILITDGYHAWVETKHLGILPEASHHVIAPRALMTIAPDIKSPEAGYLPMGSQVTLGKAIDRFCAVIGAEGQELGFILADHVLPQDEYVDDYVNTAEMLMGTPYRWGGRDSFGFDCSALVQLSLATAGVPVKRNSGDQEKTIGVTLDSLDALKRGDLVFWKGHVGIMTSASRLLHANAHHMSVASEPLSEAVKRIGAITAIRRLPE